MRFLIRRAMLALVFTQSVCAYAVDPQQPESNSSPATESTIDWSKPVVSRGFGRSQDIESTDPSVQQIYKTGEVAYFYQDYARAMQIWMPLAERGLADAQANIGWMWQAGLGVRADVDKARQWYEKAADRQHSIALNNLGVIYEDGLGVAADIARAVTYYEQSARGGYRYGQYNFGLCLLQGKGVARDEVRGREWLRKAAEQGVDQAERWLKDEIKMDNAGQDVRDAHR